MQSLRQYIVLKFPLSGTRECSSMRLIHATKSRHSYDKNMVPLARNYMPSFSSLFAYCTHFHS